MAGLRIAYIQNANLPTEWANGLQIMRTCEAFAAAGVRTDLILPSRKNPNRGTDVFEYYGMKPTFSVRWLPVVDLLPFFPFALERFPYVLERWTYVRGVHRMLDREIVADAWYTRDVVIARSLMDRENAKPVVLELHDEPRIRPERWKAIKDRVAAYIVISNGLRALLLSEGIPEERILVSPDGYDAEEFSRLPAKADARAKLGIAADARVVAYAGQLFPWKGLDALIPFFDRVPGACELVIVGGQPEDFDRIRPMMPASMPHARFVGQVPRAVALEWLAAADAGLLPTSAKFEIGRLFTSPLKLFEYLAAGLPAIASDVPSSREILDDRTALFFDPDSGLSFLQSLERFAALTPDAFAEMSRSARDKASGFTWTERGARIARFLSERLGV